MSYAAAAPMTELVACPFCRQLFEPGEVNACPDCDLGLKELAKLPPSYDALVEYPELPVPPHMETLPWAYAGRNRALLLGIAVLGLLFFFMPWVHETAPELRTLSGFDLAHIRPFYWAPATAWFVVLPLVLTRRSIYKMRGARVAVAFLAGIALITVALLRMRPLSSGPYVTVHVEWAWGLYASGAAALAAVVAALGFGGKLDDVPTKAPRRGDEILH
jgi:hypothetical protein